MSEITVQFDFKTSLPKYQPGELLECEFRLTGSPVQLRRAEDAVVNDKPTESERPRNRFEEINAIETSVLWRTTGKGNEDIGVHFFKRQGKRELVNLNSENIHRFTTILPKSPLSYSGTILNINWLVRVKLFFKKGKQSVFDQPLKLGAVKSPDQLQADVVTKSNEEDTLSESDE